MTFDQWAQVAKWVLGALAVIAAFLLVQGEMLLPPWFELLLGAFLALAAYVNPASIVAKIKSEPVVDPVAGFCPACGQPIA